MICSKVHCDRTANEKHTCIFFEIAHLMANAI